jgi:hypothetical protein
LLPALLIALDKDKKETSLVISSSKIFAKEKPKNA